ncbi:MAG TPA: hypothetical protein VGI95_00860 [Caulobacteraceae bacterium]|jgi:hypothetical protein
MPTPGEDHHLAERFRLDGYLRAPRILPQPVLDYLRVYYRILRANNRLAPDEHCPNSPAAYGDPALDAVLEWLRPEVGRQVGCDLASTFSFTRLYAKDEVLERHTDRPECEVSVSICIERPGDAGPSVLRLKSLAGDEAAVEMREGDGCIYAGRDVEHWREPVPADGYVQLFLHYIRVDGKQFPQRVFDGRAFLGAPSAGPDGPAAATR